VHCCCGANEIANKAARHKIFLARVISIIGKGAAAVSRGVFHRLLCIARAVVQTSATLLLPPPLAAAAADAQPTGPATRRAADLITLIQQLCTYTQREHSFADAFYSARVSVHV
jgi:ABC-type phosphate transport system ATPase subunit